MGASLIRSRSTIARIIDRDTPEEILDGAVLQEDGIITAVGTFRDLHARHPHVPVIGDGSGILLPGMVNAHHHVGLTPVQLGSPDMPLELWFITRLVMRSPDLYLDTLYSAFEMIASGVTTVQHLHSWSPGNFTEVEAKSAEVLRAYDDIGMRVSYCYAVRDQNRLTYQADAALIASLPEELRGPVHRHLDRFKLTVDDAMALFRTLHDTYGSRPRTRIQLAPANLHWCSDRALECIAETSRAYDAQIHMHLVETAYQREYAERRSGGGTAVSHIDRFGLVNERLTIGHGVWLTEGDIERLAEAGSCICHNCSSNFRLRSGIAPLNVFEKHGIETAIGIDEAGINDDRDMLQELRLVLRAHRVPGMNEHDVPTVPQVLRMATSGGAKTTPFGTSIGTLDVGKSADMFLVDWNHVAYPFLDPDTSTLDAVVQRAKSTGVRMTMCAGEVIYRDGKFTKVDRDAALRTLHDDLQAALTEPEVERRKLAKALLPHVRKFYADYIDPTRHDPFYRQNSRS